MIYTIYDKIRADEKLHEFFTGLAAQVNQFGAKHEKNFNFKLMTMYQLLWLLLGIMAILLTIIGYITNYYGYYINYYWL